jgi:hypothetical protein
LSEDDEDLFRRHREFGNEESEFSGALWRRHRRAVVLGFRDMGWEAPAAARLTACVFERMFSPGQPPGGAEFVGGFAERLELVAREYHDQELLLRHQREGVHVTSFSRALWLLHRRRVLTVLRGSGWEPREALSLTRLVFAHVLERSDPSGGGSVVQRLLTVADAYRRERWGEGMGGP